MKEVIRQEIEALRTLKTKALKERYRELFGEHSPSSNRAHLFRRIAWRLQANTTGGLSEHARQRAKELAVDADVRLRVPGWSWTNSILTKIQTRLCREVGGFLLRVHS